MRRWLAVLLMVLLPLQLSWAVAASYCSHETGAAADHFGHHDHAGHSHVSQDADPDHPADADGTSSELSDIDCGHCHGYCAGVLEVLCDFVARADASPPPAWVAAPGAEHVPAQPERPQWVRLA
jgi:hypothetical protein